MFVRPSIIVIIAINRICKINKRLTADKMTRRKCLLISRNVVDSNGTGVSREKRAGWVRFFFFFRQSFSRASETFFSTAVKPRQDRTISNVFRRQYYCRFSKKFARNVDKLVRPPCENIWSKKSFKKNTCFSILTARYNFVTADSGDKTRISATFQETFCTFRCRQNCGNRK